MQETMYGGPEAEHEPKAQPAALNIIMCVQKRFSVTEEG